MLVAVVATFVSLAAATFAAYAIERLRFRGARHVGMAIFLAYLVPPSILFIPLGGRAAVARAVQHALGADADVSDVPDPVLHVAADGLLPDDPVRARGMRADRRRDALADPGAGSCCRSRCRG